MPSACVRVEGCQQAATQHPRGVTRPGFCSRPCPRVLHSTGFEDVGVQGFAVGRAVQQQKLKAAWTPRLTALYAAVSSCDAPGSNSVVYMSEKIAPRCGWCVEVWHPSTRECALSAPCVCWHRRWCAAQSSAHTHRDPPSCCLFA
jgi:hypothetical protein